jgi:SM-20-related protein
MKTVAERPSAHMHAHSKASAYLDLQALAAATLSREPFDYVVVPRFVRSEALGGIHQDYPKIGQPGSFPVDGLSYGPAFAAFLDELRGPAMRAAFEQKFDLDLSRPPMMITVRGQSGTRDGNIHTDSVSKIITVLIYMNPHWEEGGGRLRLLRSATDIDDVLVEIPPVEGTLVAFRRSDNSYHGHKPFIGPRRVIQVNWVTGHGTRSREIWRHRLSAWFKRGLAVFQGGSNKEPEHSR